MHEAMDELVTRANAGDAEAALTLIAQRVSEAIAESPIEPGKARLRIHRPNPRIYPNLPRSMAMVDKDLLTLFSQLAAGKAPWPLYLHGPCGSGKTRAALCLLDCVHRSSYQTVETVCDRIMAGEQIEETDTGLNYYRALDDAHKDPAERQSIAVLDELGCRQKIGDLEYSAVKRFADHREMKHKNVAVYISNLTPEQLRAVYDERVASRVLCGTWFHLKGPDRRFQG